MCKLATDSVIDLYSSIITFLKLLRYQQHCMEIQALPTCIKVLEWSKWRSTQPSPEPGVTNFSVELSETLSESND